MGDSRVYETLAIESHKGCYLVKFVSDALDQLNGIPSDKVHFLIDRRIAELYGAGLGNVLNSRSVLLLDATEDSKSLDRFPSYVENLLSRSVRRDDLLIAVGGGIIQDITAFLAATLLRGIDWRYYPTTLLSQADSCIGSKSSINAGGAKNILGTFTPPRDIVIDGGFLDTLDERDVRSGVGEILKVHAIEGPSAFSQVARDYHRILEEKAVMEAYIRRALLIKKKYIEMDEFDRGPRNVFNYGHTFGHAIEAATNYDIPHGIAVTIGMDMANFVAVRLGMTKPETYSRMKPVLTKNFAGFEDHPVPIDLFLSAIAKDKKNVDVQITAILPQSDASLAKVKIPNDDHFHAICETYLTGERRQ